MLTRTPAPIQTRRPAHRSIAVGVLVCACVVSLAGCAQRARNVAELTKESSSAVVTPGAAAGAVTPSTPSVSPSPVRPQKGAPRVAAKGAALTTVTVAPPKTLAMVPLPKGFKGARYSAVVEPYGWAMRSDAAGKGRLAVRLVSLKKLGGTRVLPANVEGGNALLLVQGPVYREKSLDVGGRYEVVLSLQPAGGAGELRVESVK